MTTDKMLGSGSFVVAIEDQAYFMGSVSECSAFIKGYNERQSHDGTTTEFEVMPATAIKIYE